MNAWFGLFGSTQMPERNRLRQTQLLVVAACSVTAAGLAALALVET